MAANAAALPPLRRHPRVLPGLGLGMGVTLFWLGLIVLIPLAGVFLRAAVISDEAARESAGIALCRSAAEEFRAGEIPENGEKAYFTKDMTSCAEADAYYYIETEVTAAETETGALYAGKITAYTAEQDKEIYALNVRCYQPKEGTP